MDNKTPIYLFISQDCRNSIALIEEIKKKPEIAKNIQAISVESAPHLPPNLTHVPTLLIEGKMIVGKECFTWIQEQGNLEAGPLITSHGFDTSSYSFIDNENSPNANGVNDNHYSFLDSVEQQSKQQLQQQQFQQPNQQQFQQQFQPKQQLPFDQVNDNIQKESVTNDFERLQQSRDAHDDFLKNQQKRVYG